MGSLPPELSWIALEHEVAEILANQEVYGWSFDVEKARTLECTLGQELHQLTREAHAEHPLVQGADFTPRRKNSTKGYFPDAPFCKLIDFNPTSREHIAFILSNFYGWKPHKLTETGKPVVDEFTLKDIGSPQALKYLRLLELTKAYGMLSEGKNAWLRLVINGRLHHNCSVSTATHRCAHRKPNLAQVPSEGRFRELFTATKGQVMVGADLSGIELRMFAHYLARYDSGRYADILLNGDIHQVNADKIGIDRRTTKTITYAFLYGAGDQKIGLSYDPQLAPAKATAKGREIRQAYLDAIDGLELLVKAVKHKTQMAGYINSIDGRPIFCDKPHKALNYLLQSGAGVIAKRWMVLTHDIMAEAKINANQLAFVHDELQFETTQEYVSDLKFTLLMAAQAAGEFYQLRVPLGAEAASGSNWSQVH